MPDIEIKNLNINFSNKKQRVTAVNNLSLTIKSGDFLVVIGPSGCGKTSLLRALAGSLPYEGEILFDGISGKYLSNTDKSLAFLNQNFTLYPMMTVFDNIALPLKLIKVPFDIVTKKVTELAQEMNLTHLLTRKPSQISKGQQQKVALAKCIIRKPSVCLFDEPFSNLDEQTKIQLRIELAHLHEVTKATFIYSTHSQTDALALATKLAVMNNGEFVQHCEPLEVYENPTNDFVRNFMHGDEQ